MGMSRRWMGVGIGKRARDAVYSLAGFRKMSTGAAPLLMLPPAVDGRGKIAYTFRGVANDGEIPSRRENTMGSGADELRLPPDLIKDVKFVGSTHGWLALFNRRNRDLFLSNPIAERHIKLPPPRLRTVDRVVLSCDPDLEKSRCLAFQSGLEGGLALCSPRRSDEWTVFGTADVVYDNLVYSGRHRRLFCVGFHSKLKSIVLESWDPTPSPVPMLDWTINPPDSDVLTNDSFYYSDESDWPHPRERKYLYSQLRYVACAHHSGQLLLVVRYVNLRAGPRGSFVNKLVYSECDGSNYMRIPYKTVDFDVYRVDVEDRRVVRMKDSLEGLAIFVGINHPLALAPSHGLKPDSVYFTDENGLAESTRLERTNYGGHDNGIFDYRSKEISPCCELYPVEYERIRKTLPLPLWFVPSTYQH